MPTFFTFTTVKPIAFILSLVMLFSTVVPCSVFDRCEDEVCTEQSPDTKDKSCKDCPPFSMCSAGNEYVANNNLIIQRPETHFPALTTFIDLNSFIDSDYHPTLFQPPRC